MSLLAKLPLRIAVVGALVSMMTVGSWATEKILHNFVPAPDGANSASSLISDGSGNLYGTTQFGGYYSLGTVFKLTPKSGGGWTETVLYDFRGGALGSYPAAGLVMDSAGNLYGTTSSGGYLSGNCPQEGCGTVFELAPDADGKWSYKILHAFQSSDGGFPRTSLILDSTGDLFGTTPYAGSGGGGTVFELTPDAGGKWTENVLYSFSGNLGAPSAVIFDSAGNLYGTTINCCGGGGAVFELSPSSSGSWTENVLYTFCAQPHCADGDEPSGVIFDQAGNLYGVTFIGGTKNNDGVAFELSPGAGGVWTESVLYRFQGGKDGLAPLGSLVFDSAGNLYGSTFAGGEGRLCEYGCGAVFELTKSSGGSWSESVLHSFRAGRDGLAPSASLISDRNGNLYGTTEASGAPPDFNGDGTVFELSPSSGGWTETVHNFWAGDGAAPVAGLIFDGSGNLYGTTSGGGFNRYGVVFKLAPLSGGGWLRTILYNFKGGTDGAQPVAGLIFDGAGNLYGTTSGGGTGGYGTVFELTPISGGEWTEKVLYGFKGGYSDGDSPFAGLVFDSTGNLYGTTGGGGSGGNGTVFELTPSSGGGWVETVIYNFTGGADGADPQAGLTWDAAGNLYGTTFYSGDGAGVVFELSPSSGGTWTESVLYKFSGGADGSQPRAGVVFDQLGNLYGTTESGGPRRCANRHPCGVVFKLALKSGNTWKESVIYDFRDGGHAPVAGLVLDSTGNLYGTTSNGGPGDFCCGTVFKLAPTSRGGWKETTLNSFTGGKIGAYPAAGVILDAAGNLYGTTDEGGSANAGVVFEIAP